MAHKTHLDTYCPACGHNVADMGPFYVVERRNPDGTLDLKGKQPPFVTASQRQIFDFYFAQNRLESATQESVKAWYAEQGWSYRLKTW